MDENPFHINSFSFLRRYFPFSLSSSFPLWSLRHHLRASHYTTVAGGATSTPLRTLLNLSQFRHCPVSCEALARLVSVPSLKELYSCSNNECKSLIVHCVETNNKTIDQEFASECQTVQTLYSVWHYYQEKWKLNSRFIVYEDWSRTCLTPVECKLLHKV